MGGGNARPYVAPDVEVVGIELQQCVMVGSEVATQRLIEEDFVEW